MNVFGIISVSICLCYQRKELFKVIDKLKGFNNLVPWILEGINMKIKMKVSSLFTEKESMPESLKAKWTRLVDLISRVMPGSIIWLNGKDGAHISPKTISLSEINQKWGDLYEKISTSSKNFFLTDPKAGVRSFLGFPILWPDKDFYGSLCILDMKKDLINELNTSILQDFADQFNDDLALFYHQNQLKIQVGERKKELNLLYFLTEISFIPSLTVTDILQETVHKIPTGWQYPEITCAKIVLDGTTYQTENFTETPWVQIADILMDGKKNGMVAVYYLKEMPSADEGPFLQEERDLINGIVRLLNFTISEKKTREILEREKLFFDKVLGAAPGLFFVLDSLHRFVRWNQHLQDLSGLRAEELKQSLFTDILLEEDKNQFDKLVCGKGKILDMQTQQFREFQFQFEHLTINELDYTIGYGIQTFKETV